LRVIGLSIVSRDCGILQARCLALLMTRLTVVEASLGNGDYNNYRIRIL